MSDAYEERVYIEALKARCNPATFDEQTWGFAEALVASHLGQTNPHTLSSLTRQLVSAAYTEVSQRGMDAECFNNDKMFMRSLGQEIVYAAQKYKERMERGRSSYEAGEELGR